MPALETVTVQHERAKAPRQVRISRNVKRAIDFMVHEGLKRQDAATKAGLQDNSLYIALRKPEVLAYLNSQQQVLRTSAAARSIARVDTLADESKSDNVKLEANKFLLGIEGVAPTQRVENTHHLHLNVPGLRIVFGASVAPHLMTDQVHQVERQNEYKALQSSVPHPSLRNAIDATFEEVPATPGGVAGVGEKP